MKKSQMKQGLFLVVISAAGLVSFAGCGPGIVQQPVAQAPPVYNNGAASQGYNNNQAPQGYGNAPAQNGGAGVYQWQDVPVGQQVPISRAVFDQGGYQIFARSGETIVVPFANHNMYVMKFGQTNGEPYFVNEGTTPILYLPQGGFLENASAQGARWYPFSSDYSYSRPVYVALAPSWNDYAGMGWYPGMHYYGGMWGYNPYDRFAWMPGFYINIGGTRYRNYGAYQNYYTTYHNYVPNRVVYNNYNTRSTGLFRSSGSNGSYRQTGSYGSGRASGGFGSASGSTGSFSSGRRNPGFGSASSSSAPFGSSRTGSGYGGASGSGGSFGSTRGNSGYDSSGSSSGSFGGGRRSGGSFGGGSSGYSSRPSSSGGSFGGGRSSGSSFGGSRRR